LTAIDREKEIAMTQVIHRTDLRNALPDAEASHQFEGLDFGDIAVSFFWTDAPAGTGPRLHQHPYAEIFVVQEGHVAFTVGGETFAATGGQIVIAPPGQPHTFIHAGHGRSRHLDIHPTGRMNTATIRAGKEILTTQVIHRHDLPQSGTAHQFEGQAYGDIPLSFFWTDAPAGTGPRLHQHPYAEVFVIQEGHATFTVGDETIEATGGQIVIVPREQPHTFVNTGAEPLRQLAIHTSGRMETRWLED
jgi:mannose-6-phosphate isomerase-like protein (cupin superfamily)